MEINHEEKTIYINFNNNFYCNYLLNIEIAK